MRHGWPGTLSSCGAGRADRLGAGHREGVAWDAAESGTGGA